MRPPVERCRAVACAYNLHDGCHAKTVEIDGDASCLTFTRSVMFTVNPRFHSQVCICEASDCAHNRLTGCKKEKISIGGPYAGTEKGAPCLGYNPKKK